MSHTSNPRSSLAPEEADRAVAPAHEIKLSSGDETLNPIPRAEMDSYPTQPEQITTRYRIWWLYAVWIRPFIRSAVLLLAVMYFFVVTGNVLTYRHQSTFGSEPFHLVLPDLFYFWFPKYALDSSDAQLLYRFVNGTPMTILGLMFLCLFLRGSTPKLVEVIWAESVALFLNAVIQVSTVLPDSVGTQKPCTDPRYRHFGSWVFTRISNEYCGDMIWSGHIFHCMFGIFVLRGLLHEYFGAVTDWAFRGILRMFDAIAVLWIIAEVYAMFKIRFHYSVDIQLAIIIACLLFTHRPFLDFGVALLYVRPPPPLPTASDVDAKMEADARQLSFLRRSVTPDSVATGADIEAAEPSVRPIEAESGDGTLSIDIEAAQRPSTSLSISPPRGVASPLPPLSPSELATQPATPTTGNALSSPGSSAPSVPTPSRPTGPAAGDRSISAPATVIRPACSSAAHASPPRGYTVHNTAPDDLP